MTASFSEKQLRAMTWWMPKSRDHGFDALVCDGAVRSGKTLAMGLGFFLWAMSCFTGRRFALCGKTRGGVRRNVVQELLPVAAAAGDDGFGEPDGAGAAGPIRETRK